MKKLFIGLIIGLCLWNQVYFASAEGASLEITTDKDELNVHARVHAYILAKDIEQTAGADIFLYYDPSKLKLISKNIEFSEEEYIDIQDHIAEIADEDGTVRIAFGLKKNVLLLAGHEKRLGTLVFEAIERGDTQIIVGGESRLVEEVTTEGNVDYQYSRPLVYISKSIVIKEEANVLGTIRGSVALSDHEDAVSTEVILFQGDTEVKRTFVQEDGTYGFTDVANGDYILRIKKLGYQEYSQTILINNEKTVIVDINLARIKEDVNRDGFVDISDLVVVGARYGIEKDGEGWLADADLNQDGKIDLLDILYISRMLE